MVKLVPTLAVSVSVLLAGCATPEPKEPPLEGTVTISSSDCPALCPVYSMRVGPDERYRLNAGANTITEGRSTGGLPVGSFRSALGLLDRYEFESMARAYTADTPDTCPDRITGTPTLTITRETNDARKIVSYDVGCIGFAEKDNLDLLVEGLYRSFRITDLVAVGEPPSVKNARPKATDPL
jgi:hypothetical protein